MQLFKITWRHIRRSPFQALAAVGIMTLTLFMGFIFFLTATGSAMVLSYFESRPQIIGFFSVDKEPENSQIQILEQKLDATGQIAEIKYVTKEEALAVYRERFKSDPLLLEMVTASMLPASIEVSAKDAKYLGELAKIIQGEQGIEEVVYQKDIVDTLITWTEALRKMGIILVGFLGIESWLVILTIIGMKIALRKEEIEILRLVGASNGYIRTPFLLEGVFYGLTGAIFSWVFTLLLLVYASPFLSSFLKGIPIMFITPLFIFSLLVGGILIGAAVGFSGSLLAVRRYLRP
jgi:cell division transport system permease protein